MKKLEFLLGLTAVLAILLKLKLLLQLSGDSALVFCALTALSFFYFVFSFALFNDIRLRDIFKKTSYLHTNAKRIIGAIVLGVTISIITIGALFKLLMLAGAAEMTLIGLMAMIIISIMAILFYFRSRASYYVNVLKRITIYSALALILLFTPNATLIGMYYRDYPEYVSCTRKYRPTLNNALRYKLEQNGRRNVLSVARCRLANPRTNLMHNK